MTTAACHLLPGGGYEFVGSGLLFYVMGASGAGKDTLLEFARAHCPPGKNLVFAHRYITRPAGYGGENHVALTTAEFELRRQHGCFAMQWHSHGFDYGIGIEILCWLNCGLRVVVSGSREYLSAAREFFPHINPILVVADEKEIANRLTRRGREDREEVQRRLDRNSRFVDLLRKNLTIVHNNGNAAAAGRELLRLVTAAK